MMNNLLAMQAVIGLVCLAPVQANPANVTETSSMKPLTNAAVRVVESGEFYTLENGLVSARIEKRNGVLRSLRYRGLELLALRGSGASGGYWSSVGRDRPGSNRSVKLLVNPADNGGDRVVISFRSFNDADHPDGTLDVDIRYALGRGEHWLYTYALWTHLPGWPGFSVGEARYAMKLNPEVFDFMTIDAERRRIMPTGEDWDQGEPLNLKEARRMTTGRYRGQPEHKYGYSAVLHETPAYGWSSTKDHVGLWIVNPSMEYLAGGPTKAELTGHLDVNPGGDPTLLNMWLGSHYGGSSFVIGQDEAWSKCVGPFLIYCNSASSHDLMWEDALHRAQLEGGKWPYDWAACSDYLTASQRGSVSGRILLHDPFQPDLQVSNMWVGVTVPDYSNEARAAGGVGRPPISDSNARFMGRDGFPVDVDWQRDAKNYQFWVRANERGQFTIPNVRPGEYWLHAIADDVLGEFTVSNIVVTAGQHNAQGELIWTPVRYGRPLWEIGIPNRTALEFKNGSRAWRWGTYFDYARDFPEEVNFIIGQSDWSQDWNYVQPPRILSRNASVTGEEAGVMPNLGWADVRSTTWSIQFEMSETVTGKATLRLAFCGTHRGCRIEVLVNGESIGDTGTLPSTSAMQRDSARAYWIEKPLVFDAAMLKQGTNVIQLVSHARSWSQGVMYDYLRLELEE